MAKTALKLRELESRVGEEVGVSPWEEISQARIDLFAAVLPEAEMATAEP